MSETWARLLLVASKRDPAPLVRDAIPQRRRGRRRTNSFSCVQELGTFSIRESSSNGLGHLAVLLCFCAFVRQTISRTISLDYGAFWSLDRPINVHVTAVACIRYIMFRFCFLGHVCGSLRPFLLFLRDPATFTPFIHLSSLYYRYTSTRAPIIPLL
jgi:hypothetical protein